MLDLAPVVVVEVVALKPPRPGFWLSVGCCLLILGTQTGVVMAALAAWIAQMALRTGSPPDAEALQDALPMSLLISAGTVGTLFGALMIVAVAYRRQMPRRLALRNASAIQWLAVLLAVLPLSILASEVTNWVAMLVPNFSVTEMFAQLTEESLAAALVFGALMAALGEELCFRGFIGRGLVARYGPLSGILLTSLLFGLVHFDPVQASGAMLLGVGIHAIYLATRSLYAPIAVHGLNNALAFTLFGFRDRLRLPGYIPGPEGTPEFTPWPLLLAASAAVAGLALVLWDTRTRFVFANGCTWDPGYTTAEQPPTEVNAAPHNGRPRVASLIAMASMQAVFLAALLACLCSLAG